MADRLRQETVEAVPLRTRLLRGEALRAQVDDRVEGASHERPHLLHEPDVVRVAVVFGDGIDELAVAVVLGDRIGAALVDATGDAPVRQLILCEPLQELARLLGRAGLE